MVTMEFSKETNPISASSADVVVIGIFESEKPADALKQLDGDIPDEILEQIKQAAEQDAFKGKTRELMHLKTFGRLSSKALMFIGLGDEKEYDLTSGRRFAAIAARNSGKGLSTVCLVLRNAKSRADIQAAVEGWQLASYAFLKYKSSGDETKEKRSVSHVSIRVDGLNNDQIVAGIKDGEAIGSAVNFARDLIAEPASYMTPSRLAEAALELAGGNLTVEVMDVAQMQELSMGAFLGVARGALEPAKFIVMRYDGGSEAKRTVALCGKGITFDSGGLSLKTAAGMEHMKYDMSGAAAVLGTMQALSKLAPPLHVLGLIAATENMPGHGALHPGDVLVAMNGKTIEVNNTDAEGRLVLADALAYAVKQNPDEIIDIATLTGAVVTALGRVAAGIMGSNRKLMEGLVDSGKLAGEKFWPLPLFDEYKDSLKSDIADLKNAGSKGEASTSCAGMFLREFVNGKPWAHLDIAGPAWMDKEKDELNKGGTAFGVRTLCYYLLNGDKNRSNGPNGIVKSSSDAESTD